jgi:hypothetical protein
VVDGEVVQGRLLALQIKSNATYRGRADILKRPNRRPEAGSGMPGRGWSAIRAARAAASKYARARSSMRRAVSRNSSA